MLMMMLLKLLLLMLLLASPIGSEELSSPVDRNKLAIAEPSDGGYSTWLKNMASSLNKHALFQKPMNKVRPCLTLKVKKKKHSRPSRSRVFSTLRKALESIPVVNNCRVVISIGKGTYREKVEIPTTMAYITLKGAGTGKTVIEWDDTADRIGANGHPLGTFGSSTFAVNSPYFIAKNITFKNNAPPPPSGALGKQAVALRISGDNAAFISCKFIGAQDTLYDHLGRHYFKHCYIEGSVDFVFGNGLSLYENCHLHAISNTFGALTAQKRESLLEETGFSFVKCKVTGSGALYLGRAWGSFSRVVFAYTYMDKIIKPQGWYDWGDKNREMTVFYGQYKCWGPGANFGGRVPWSRELTDAEAQPFVSLGFIDGHEWLHDLL